MLRFALAFLILALIAGLLGFTGIAGEFLVVFLAGLIYSVITGRRLNRV